MEYKVDLCCKCQKFRVANKRYMLCKFCNFERTHNGLTMWQSNINKSNASRLKKPRDLNLAIIRDPILTPRIRLCKILGCTDPVKGKTGYCTSHTIVKTKNRKKTAQQEKSSSVANQMSQIKKEAKINHYLKDGGCEGCGKSNINLDYSHILSVGQRKDLELEKGNKNLLCRSCHNDWESWNMARVFKLHCIDYNLNYIRANDEKTFWRLYFKCIDHQMFTQAKQMEKIDEEFKIKNNV